MSSLKINCFKSFANKDRGRLQDTRTLEHGCLRGKKAVHAFMMRDFWPRTSSRMKLCNLGAMRWAANLNELTTLNGHELRGRQNRKTAHKLEQFKRCRNVGIFRSQKSLEHAHVVDERALPLSPDCTTIKGGGED